MKLSKLAMRCRSHDWAAAGVEPVIVVAGILIAPEVDNRNQGRVDRARADGCELVSGH